jgi:S1-C subfamily serine protease
MLALSEPARLVAAQSKSPRQIAQEAFPSVVLLLMEDAYGQPSTLGSGFVLREGLVATNCHVIQGAVRGYAKLVGQPRKYEITGIAASDAAHDLSILGVEGLKAPGLPIGDSGEVAVGDDVYAIGNPQGLEGTFSQGIVSAVRHLGNDTVLQITALISPGSSGGPILNSAGRAIGIALATFKDGQNLNLAVPSSYLTALSSALSTELLPLSRERPGSAVRSMLRELGDPTVGGVIGDKFDWAGPSGGEYSFSLRNQLREPVRDVSCLIIFFDREKRPIEVDHQTYPGPHDLHGDFLAGGLAKRLTGKVDPSVQKLSSTVEIRVLDFRLVR